MDFLAFSTSVSFLSSQNQLSSYRQKNLSKPRPTRSKWTCLAKSHPYGNGGLDLRLDFSDYDKEALEAELIEEEKKFDELIKKRPPGPSKWIVIVSTDLIQWKNNLIKASRENGYNWDLTGLYFLRYDYRTIEDIFRTGVSSVWVIEIKGSEILTCGSDEGEELLMCFEADDEVNRFIDHLHADGYDSAVKKSFTIPTVENMADSQGLLLGFIPAKTLVSPGQFTSRI